MQLNNDILLKFFIQLNLDMQQPTSFHFPKLFHAVDLLTMTSYSHTAILHDARQQKE